MASLGHMMYVTGEGAAREKDFQTALKATSVQSAVALLLQSLLTVEQWQHFQRYFRQQVTTGHEGRERKINFNNFNKGNNVACHVVLYYTY